MNDPNLIFEAVEVIRKETVNPVPLVRSIEIEDRFTDFVASLQDNQEIWGCGETVAEAIGNLVKSHQDVFGVKVIHPKPRPT